jgi:ribosomal protein S18 acetylase RimI-like enzyme
MTDAFELFHNCFPEQTLDQVQSYLSWCLDHQARGRLVRLVAEIDGQTIANGQLTLLRDHCEIGSLVVAPAYRRRGIGTMLVRALIKHARQRNLRTVEVSASVETPWIRDWYERLGFEVQGTHTFPGSERVIILHMLLANYDKETLCPPKTA